MKLLLLASLAIFPVRASAADPSGYEHLREETETNLKSLKKLCDAALQVKITAKCEKAGHLGHELQRFCGVAEKTFRDSLDVAKKAQEAAEKASARIVGHAVANAENQQELTDAAKALPAEIRAVTLEKLGNYEHAEKKRFEELMDGDTHPSVQRTVLALGSSRSHESCASSRAELDQLKAASFGPSIRTPSAPPTFSSVVHEQASDVRFFYLGATKAFHEMAK